MHIIQIFFIFLARIFLSSVFILAAVHKIIDWQETEHGVVYTLCDWLSYVHHSEGLQGFFSGLLEWVPTLLGIAIVVELLGGISILLGYKPRLGAALLILFLIPTTIFFHNFWFLEGARRDIQVVMFVKNLAILGGLFYVLVFGTKVQSSTPPIGKIPLDD